MTTPVNPPPQVRIPDKFFRDPEIRAFFERQQTILFQLYNRTGGPVDIIAKDYEIIITNSDLVLDRFGTLIVVDADAAPITITLPSITSSDVGRVIAVLVIDATFDTFVEVANPATETVLGDTSVLMDDQYMSLDYTAITQVLWNPT